MRATICLLLSAPWIALAAGCGPEGGAGNWGTPAGTVYWRTLTGAAGAAQDTLVERFNASEEGVRVNAEFQGGYADLATKLLAAAAAGRGPAVSQLGTFEIREFAQAGLLVDLRPYVEGPKGIDTAGWPGTMIEAGVVDDKLCWLPFNVSVPVLYYNKDAFAEAGIAGPPETWDDFFAYARHLTLRDEAGHVVRAGTAFWNITWPFLSMIWSEGGRLTTRDYADITLDDPVAVRLLTQVQALVAEGAAVFPPKASGGHRAAFKAGQAAMVLDSPAGYAELVEGIDAFETGVAMYPAGSAGRVYAPGGGGIVMLASTPPEDREAAWTFMKFMLSADSLAFFARESGYLAFTEEAQEAAGPWLEDPARRTMHEALPFVRGDFSVNMAPPVRNALDEALQAIAAGRMPAQEALEIADAQAELGMAGE